MKTRIVNNDEDNTDSTQENSKITFLNKLGYSRKRLIQPNDKIPTYQSYEIATEGTPYKNASRAPATVPEYTLDTSETRRVITDNNLVL